MYGPTIYIQKPYLGPGIAILPQPAKYATIRGPKSLAGFHPACVKGAYNARSIATVNPISPGITTEGIDCMLGYDLFS